jgi:hypothetical protein
MAGVGEAAAILQLVQLSGTVVSGCYAYLKSARNAPAEITRTICDIDNLKEFLRGSTV